MGSQWSWPWWEINVRRPQPLVYANSLCRFCGTDKGWDEARTCKACGVPRVYPV